MTGSLKEFKHESLQDRESVVKYLRALADGFAEGKLSLRNSERELVLTPRGLLELDIRARKVEGKINLTMKLAWKETKTEQVGGPLIIDSKR